MPHGTARRYAVNTLYRSVYLLLLVPRGFVYLVTVSMLLIVGISTLVVWIGVPILAFTLGVCWYLARFERHLANLLLGADIPPMTRPLSISVSFWRGMWTQVWWHLRRRVTWLSIGYLLAMFPFAVLVFAVFGFSIPLIVLAIGMPYFHLSGEQITSLQQPNGFWTIDSLLAALATQVAGVLLLAVLIMLINLFAIVWCRFVRVMLTSHDPDVIPVDIVSQDIAPDMASTYRVGSGSGALFEPLSEREAEVLALLAAGSSNRQIAEDLFISEGTVKRHTHNIYRKLGVNNRTRAVLRADELGILKTEPERLNQQLNFPK